MLYKIFVFFKICKQISNSISFCFSDREKRFPQYLSLAFGGVGPLNELWVVVLNYFDSPTRYLLMIETGTARPLPFWESAKCGVVD